MYIGRAMIPLSAIGVGKVVAMVMYIKAMKIGARMQLLITGSFSIKKPSLVPRLSVQLFFTLLRAKKSWTESLGTRLKETPNELSKLNLLLRLTNKSSPCLISKFVMHAILKF